MAKIKETHQGIEEGLGQIHNEGVIVLLSTYNGERFLEDLLESVLAQEGVDVFVLVRDDGSTDRTQDILQSFSIEHGNMRYSLGENIGVINSFNELISDPIVDQYPYVAFCDQDDIWLPEKLACAIEKIKNDDVPRLYCSNLSVVDENLRFLRLSRRENLRFSRYTAIAQNCATGCTEVFNQKAVTLYRMGIGCRMEMHDYWLFLLCLYLGKVCYDEHAYILYRQHEDNVIGATQKDAKAALDHMQQKYGHREAMIFDFLEVYKEQLSPEACRIATPASDVSSSLRHRLVMLFDIRYHAYSCLVTLNFKLRVALGRLY